jgi:Xaa-Pro dipeptidase
MRRERFDKVQAAMSDASIDTLLLCGQSNVSYATGARVPASDHVRASWWRAVAVVQRDDPWPHVYTEFPEGSAPELPDDHIHPAVEVEATDGAREVVSMLPGGRLALDEAPFPLWQALGERDVLDAAVVLGAAKLTKTLDELECIRQAQAINERAMRTARAAARPGALATDLSGAFLRTAAELGAT